MLMRVTSLPLRDIARRFFIEGWLLACFLLFPIMPVLLSSPPLPRSLYLILLPIICAIFVGLRMKTYQLPGHGSWLFELSLAFFFSLGFIGLVIGAFFITGNINSLQQSSAGINGTIFFLALIFPEYLGIRALTWGWDRWNQLRRRQFVWALTHAILTVVVSFLLLILISAMLFLSSSLGDDIWGIPPDSLFAKSVFWISIFILISAALFLLGFFLFLPPAILFSFLVARRMTKRIEDLAQSTKSMLNGDFFAKVPISGEDEIAQLQVDFNTMTESLHQSITELKAEKEKVWKMMEDRREFVAEISHELRNPVAVIIGYSDALQTNLHDRSILQVEKDLEKIQYEASRLQNILNDLLVAAQMESGEFQITLQKVDIVSLTIRLVNTFSDLAWNNKRVQINFSSYEPEIHIMGDALRLEQIIVNLLQNAIRHTSPGGLVSVDVYYQSSDTVCLEVEDTGEGILKEDLPHIWEKYYQGGNRQHGVAGLGLPLVKELTEAMGGNVMVESSPGEGSKFCVVLQKNIE